ncbi:DNA replication/repair protein RecF [Peptostreptococcus equinus]|uniref:DNA replication and repair protein RecF n=1 Tax=Peptostreptococcus equinus TaxID=3003601 RepID=A0ABY7JNH8_9FIRM|nr:DNA replication/repair protein RecF [Peptostreptococcus sp. CBA3647]WAW14921.1 DNA replication/repair protein RecF [Peptostreptococcus sp. CBA3647]
MYIKSVILKDYRNYKNLFIEFNENVNLIIGPNGQGKTNIVESISLMSIGRSFRTSKDKELIRFGCESLYSSCSFNKRNLDKKIEIIIQKDKKGIKVNGVSIKSIQELLGNLNVVVFSPEDLRLVKDGPKERRTFIDKEISQIMPRYYNILTSYNKILNQRNKLLKSYNIDYNLLDVYDQSMADFGSEIYVIRNKFIKKLANISNNMHKNLTSGVEELKIKYRNQIKFDDDNYDIGEVKNKILELMLENREHDCQTRTTKIGPHKDDLGIYINDIDVRLYGSQGQQRTASISLKLSEVELIKQEVGDYPVLILDDVFSELDQNRQKMLIDKLENIQMFVTSADPLHKHILSKNKYTIFNIDKGEIVKIENGGK